MSVRQLDEHAPLLRADSKRGGNNDEEEEAANDHGLLLILKRLAQLARDGIFLLAQVSAIVIVFAVCINWTTDGLIIAALLRGKSDSQEYARLMSTVVAVVSLLFRVFYATCILWVTVSASKEMASGLSGCTSRAVLSFIRHAWGSRTCSMKIVWSSVFVIWVLVFLNAEYHLLLMNLYGHFQLIFWYTVFMGTCTIAGLCLLLAEMILWVHQLVNDPELPAEAFSPRSMLCTVFHHWGRFDCVSWCLLLIHSFVHAILFLFTLRRLLLSEERMEFLLMIFQLSAFTVSFLVLPHVAVHVVPTFLNLNNENMGNVRFWLWLMCATLAFGIVSIAVQLVFNRLGALFGALSISLFFGILWSVIFDNHRDRSRKKLNYALVIGYLLLIWACFTMVLLHTSSSPRGTTSPENVFLSPPTGPWQPAERKTINHSVPVYGVCQKDWYGMNVLELGEISRIAYEIPSYSSEDSIRATIASMTQFLNHYLCSPEALMEPRPPFNRIQYCPFSIEKVSSSPPFFAHIKGGNLNVIVIRGSADVLDFFEDFQVWSEIGTLQLVSFFVPLYHFWPVRLTAQYAWLVDFGFHSDMYVKEVENYMKEANLLDYRGTDPYKRVLLTGHSLGGGLAAIIGARTEHRSIGFSSPGATLQHVKFNFEWESLRKTSTTIFGYGDYVPNFDIHSGLIQAVMCRAPEGLQCHSIDDLLCEIASGCPMLTDLYLTDVEYWRKRCS
mmetsp:Transcript_6356/g.15353  ORF Transcript_6356/g.15353 Transcript_6356/m.15353 type:complete len:725 (-) Transcript_6356:134-2308(-)